MKKTFRVRAILFFLVITIISITGEAYSHDGPISNNIGDITSKGDTIWVATDEGLSISYNGGNTWEYALQGHSFTALKYGLGQVWCASSYYAIPTERATTKHLGRGLFHYSPERATWDSLFPLPDTWSANFTEDYVSTDGGINLVCFNLNLVELPAAEDSSEKDTTIWAPYWYGGLLKSTDGGNSWENVFMEEIQTEQDPNEKSNRFFAFTADSSDEDGPTLFAGSGDGLFYTSEGIESWEKLYTTEISFAESAAYQESLGVHFRDSLGIINISGNRILELATHYPPGVEQSVIWAATRKADRDFEYSGISRSLDGGETWEVVDSNLHAWNFAFHDSNTWVASEEGLLKSEDFGDTWEKIDIVDDLTGVRISSKEVISVHYNQENLTLWVGTPQGLAYSEDEGENWRIIKTYPPPQKTSDKTYAFPTPFSPFEHKTVSVVFPLSERQDVTVTIYDYSLYEVTTLTKEDKGPNPDDTAEIQWDGSNKDGLKVDNGIYFYQVETSNDTYWGKIAVLK